MFCEVVNCLGEIGLVDFLIVFLGCRNKLGIGDIYFEFEISVVCIYE